MGDPEKNGGKVTRNSWKIGFVGRQEDLDAKGVRELKIGF